MNTFAFCSSAERINQFLVAYNSIRKFHPDTDINLLFCDPVNRLPKLPEDVKVSYYPKGQIDCIARVYFIKLLLESGYTKVISLDNDMELFAPMDDIFWELLYNDAIVTPHILKPLPNDGKHPSMEDIVFSGNYNSAFFACNQHAKPFIDWWFEITTLKPNLSPKEGHFAEQGWLRFIGDFLEDVVILKDTRYNVAYWNYKQRDLQKRDDTWYTTDGPMVLYHYSGLVNAEKISQHQDREIATGEFKEFLQSYIERTK